MSGKAFKAIVQLVCPECGAPMHFQPASRFGPFYGCSRFPVCRATHGAHPDGAPLGIPATHKTKLARIAAHEAFDMLWKRGGAMSRGQAYRWMQEAMGMTDKEAHIGRFDEAQCTALVAKVTDFFNRRRVTSGRLNRVSFRSRDGRFVAQAKVLDNEHRHTVGVSAWEEDGGDEES